MLIATLLHYFPAPDFQDDLQPPVIDFDDDCAQIDRPLILNRGPDLETKNEWHEFECHICQEGIFGLEAFMTHIDQHQR